MVWVETMENLGRDDWDGLVPSFLHLEWIAKISPSLIISRKLCVDLFPQTLRVKVATFAVIAALDMFSKTRKAVDKFL